MYCHGARIYVLLDFVPDWFQGTAMRTPVCKEVDLGKYIFEQQNCFENNEIFVKMLSKTLIILQNSNLFKNNFGINNFVETKE